MKRLKVLLVAFLLVATLGMIATTGNAEMMARPATPCTWMGCNGGADFCGSIMIIINDVVVVWVCYTNFAR